jgi:hypothetical protein
MHYRHHRSAPGKFKRDPVKRNSFFLNYVPKEGLYCVAERRNNSSLWTPLACHRYAQDALEDDDIPVWQGMTHRDGVPRNIDCRGVDITVDKNFPYRRKDGRAIIQIDECANHTKRKGWYRDNWIDEPVPDNELGDLTFKQSAFLMILAGLVVMKWVYPGGA